MSVIFILIILILILMVFLLSYVTQLRNPSMTGGQRGLLWTRDTPSPHLFTDAIREPLTPADQFERLVTRYGEPDFFDPSPQGLAIWKEPKLTAKQSCVNRLILNDYPIHYLTMMIEYPMKSARGSCESRRIVKQITQISPQISYDVDRYMISIVGNRYEENLALAVPALRLLQGKLDLEKAKALGRETLASINPRAKTYSPNAIEELENQICLILHPEIR